MRQLQSNFTTSEQSKRLLELGVPVLTADGQYNDFNGEILVLPVTSVFSPKYENNVRKPCWSVGRLIEIAELCYNPPLKQQDQEFYIRQKDCNTDYLVRMFALCINSMDFSRL